MAIVLALVAAACSSGTQGEETTSTAAASPTTSEGTAASTTTAPPETTETTAPAEPINIAYLSASSANTWLLSSKAEMEKVADATGFKIVEFDGQFNPETQTQQLQDIIASGDYAGVVVCGIFGEGLIPDLQDAMDRGMEVVVLNQVVGPKLDTPDPQVEGFAASILAPPLRSGERMGELTLQACEGVDPCRVVYFYGIKGTPIDTALRQGFDAVISQNPAIEVVAEGEGKYLGPEQGMTAMQDIMQATPEFEVVVGADQPIQGVEIVLADEGRLDAVKLIGLGGSVPALEAIADGRWFGDVFGAPGTEGRLAMEAMVDAVLNGNHEGGIDPLATLPDNGLVTRDNVDKFTAEWQG
ncbi:MAG: substrate-binding domain-containing protein [Gammaproteobacteria bacterium]|nr:substrate-binding domain-containing protein [Gammaproteobacteria bacterium]